MAQPVIKKMQCSKEELMLGLRQAAQKIGLPIIGKKSRLGLTSFRISNDEILYAHCAKKDEVLSTVALASGLAYLEKCDQSELPLATIHKLTNQLEQYV